MVEVTSVPFASDVNLTVAAPSSTFLGKEGLDFFFFFGGGGGTKKWKMRSKCVKTGYFCQSDDKPANLVLFKHICNYWGEGQENILRWCPHASYGAATAFNAPVNKL